MTFLYVDYDNGIKVSASLKMHLEPVWDLFLYTKFYFYIIL